MRCVIAIKQFSYKNRANPPIATQEGTKYRKDIVETHWNTQFHIECVKIEKANISKVAPKETTAIKTMISKRNQQQASYVGKLLIQVYTDAKYLTLAAWNWPARYVTNEASNAYQYGETKETVPKNIKLQNVNPSTHLQLLSCIVESSIDELKHRIENCLAISIRIDGSVDRTQLDKIYVLAKIVNPQGSLELIFLGVHQQDDRGADGLLRAAFQAIENNVIRIK